MASMALQPRSAGTRRDADRDQNREQSRATKEQNREQNWHAVLDHNPRLDGVLFYAVTSTGIYCRPSCPSRRPSPRHVKFFSSARAAEDAGFRACRRCDPGAEGAADGDAAVARAVCDFVERNLDGTLSHKVLTAALGFSDYQLQRTFKRATGISVGQYVEARRFSSFKTALRAGQSVAEATYDAGYGSSSRIYESVGQRMGMTPATYRKGGRGIAIGYTIIPCRLGYVLVATTARGICQLALADNETDLLAALRGEFPQATIAPDANGLKETVATVIDYLEGKTPSLNLPLDIRMTSFQRRVYEELRRIPAGSTKSYGDIAGAIGMPKASRAVASACARNPVALAIPCHRVVRGDGALGGYRWGIGRKRALLEGEANGK